MVRETLEPSAGGSNTPDIPDSIGGNSANKIDEGIVGRPRRRMTMDSCRCHIDEPIGAARFAHEDWIARASRVEYHLPAIVRPVVLGDFLEIHLQRAAARRHR